MAPTNEKEDELGTGSTEWLMVLGFGAKSLRFLGQGVLRFRVPGFVLGVWKFSGVVLGVKALL